MRRPPLTEAARDPVLRRHGAEAGAEAGAAW
jgi:hypothetical protein